MTLQPIRTKILANPELLRDLQVAFQDLGIQAEGIDRLKDAGLAVIDGFYEGADVVGDTLRRNLLSALEHISQENSRRFASSWMEADRLLQAAAHGVFVFDKGAS